jgi:hypothetical protein
MSEKRVKISSKNRAQLCAHIFQWLVGRTLKNHTFSFWFNFGFLSLTSIPVDFCKIPRTFLAFFGDFRKKPSKGSRPLGEGTIGEGAV